MQVESMQYSLDEEQWLSDWALMLSLAGQPGAALEQIHIFALAHILRRPIIVYGVKFIKSFRGENIGYARFQGKIGLEIVIRSLRFIWISVEMNIKFFAKIHLIFWWSDISHPVRMWYFFFFKLD